VGGADPPRAPPRGCRPAAGPSEALAIVDQLDLDGHHVFHMTRADLPRRRGRRDDAIAAYDAAIARTANRGGNHSSGAGATACDPWAPRPGRGPPGSPARDHHHSAGTSGRAVPCAKQPCHTPTL